MDTKLLQACIRKSRKAQNRLYKELFSYLMNICIRYKNNYDDAGSSLNAIFLKVLNGLPRYESTRPFLPWVKTIAMRHLIDEHRRRNKLEQIDIEAIELADNKNSGQEYSIDDLLILIQQLPSSTRQVFNLFAIDGYKYREIADLLEMPESTAKWHVSQARKKLQKALNTEQIKSDQIHN